MKLAVILVCSFSAGAVFWKWRHPTSLVRQFSLQEIDLNQSKNSVIVAVGDRKITSADLQWEESYQKLFQVNEQDFKSVSPVLDFSTSFKKFALQNLVERDILIQIVHKDPEFDISQTTRLIACKKEAEQRVLEQPQFFQTQFNREKVEQDLCERALINQYFKERIAALIEVSPEEKEVFYRRNKSKFSKNQTVTFRQIVLATEQEAKKIRALARFENFSSLARKHSITPEGEKGGKLSRIEKGTLPQVFDSIFSMPTNAISDIIKTSYGFHIVIIDQKHPAQVQNFSEAESKIENTIKQQKLAEAYQSWVNNALNIIPVSSPSSSFALSAN